MESSFYSIRQFGVVTADTLPGSVLGSHDSSDFQFDTLGGTFTETDLCNFSSVLPSTPQETTLSISPNPLHHGESLVLHSGEIPSGTYYLRIFDLLGNCQRNEKMMLSGLKQDIPVIVNTLASGIYTIEIQNASGMNYRAKFVKEE